MQRLNPCNLFSRGGSPFSRRRTAGLTPPARAPIIGVSVGRSGKGRSGSWSGGGAQAFRAAAAVVETSAVVVGLPVAVFCLMAVVGHFTGNLWARLIPALIVATAVPLAIVERLTRDDLPGTGRTAGALGLMWLGFSVAFVVLAFPVTAPILGAEALRLGESGPRPAAIAAAWLARAPLPEAAGRPRQPERREAPLAEPPATEDASVAAAADGGQTDGGAEVDGALGASDAAPDAPEAPPTEPREPLPLPDLLVEAEGLLVTVSARVAGEDLSSSGVLLDGLGTVATCIDLDGVQDLAVRLPDGTWHRDVGILPSFGAGRGLALLRLEGLAPGPPPVTRADMAAAGPFLALGSPVGLEPLVALAGPGPCPAAPPANEGELLLAADGPTAGLACGPVVTDGAELVGIALEPLPGAPRCLRALPVGQIHVPPRTVEAARPRGARGARARTW